MKVRDLRFSTKLYRYVKDPSVAVWRKLAGVGALAYLVLPFDAIPDFIPMLGWLDDLGVLTAAAMFIMREVKRHSERIEAGAQVEQR
jgi:uncharacterized membrane protein YkvA (DUF1232 family)